MIQVEGPDGAVIEFPEGTAPDAMERAMKDAYASSTPAQPDTSFGARALRLVSGTIRGLRDYIDAPAQMLERGAAAVGVPTEAVNRAVGLPSADEATKIAEEDYQKNWRGGVEGVDVGRMIGNVLPALAIPAGGAAATLAGTLGRGALVGAGTSVMGTPVENTDQFWREKALQAATGAGFGAVGGAVGHAAGRAISPKTRPEVQALRSAGVKLTPGQTAGGTLERFEQGLTSWPVIGDAIKTAQVRALQSFNRSAINKTLAPIGEKLNMKTPMGREAIEEAGEKISKAYNDILPKLAVKADGQFIDDMVKLDDLAANLPAPQKDQFAKMIGREVFDRFSKADAMTGETMKQVDSTLGRLAREYRGTPNPDQRLLGDALREAQATLRRLVTRSNPSEAPKLAKIDEAYKNFLRVESAAGAVGSKEGVFTGAQLKSAVRRLDPSMNKRAFARGKATMQDIAEAGAEVLGSKVPDSGTPYRALLAGGIPLAAHLFGNPLMTGLAGAGTAAAMLPYAPYGGAFTRGLLAARPVGAAPAAEAVRRAGPALAATALPPALYGLLNDRF